MIEATGLVVAPGFIGTHTHAEGALLFESQNPMGVRQGITTLFLGIDGHVVRAAVARQLPDVPPVC